MTTPQNCADCGTRAEPGQSFCDACGAVLSWTDPAASRTPSAASRVPEPSGAAASGGSAGAAASAGSSAAADAPAGRGDAPDPAPAPQGAGHGPGDGGGSDARGQASAGSASAGSASAAGAPSGAVAGGTASAGTATPPGAPAATAASPEAARGTAPEWPASPRPDGAGHDPAGPASRPGGEPAGDAWHDPHRSRENDTLPNATPGVHYFSDPADAPAAPGSADPAPEPASWPTPPAGTPAAAPGAPLPGSPEDAADRARRLLIPVADPDAQPAAAPSVAPVLPGRPAPQRPQSVRAPGEELGADGGLPCPWCGTRNRPERHYCARCAMPMAGDRHAPVRLPWWRRLLRGGNREAPWAGDRPRLRRAFDRVLTWLGAAIVLTLLIVLAVKIPDGVQATRDHFAKRAPVAPDRVSASRSYPGHKPDLAFDKINNTWWGPGVSESGQGQWIEARFDQPTRLLNLIITPGVSIRADQLSKSALPHRVEARITLADGKTTTRELVLDQGAGPQTRAFRVGKATAVRFTIESAYQPSATKQVSIAEIEFFGPSNSSGS
ncbi:NADase-type glycan-binding domain-containing protein [Streptomyces sp. NRRL S-340]|uniref:NADase-type glycan-binding domain-containing protein n=1 Tax=Streptomyces sp. NRRL S-340 TaxID=1463901 RepID=UPI000565DE2A|nr:hypothetical protein [Streptomyces sp. NRRL S-340]